jgi:serine protease Do
MKRTALTSLVLLTVGIIFGAVLVSNFSTGVDLGFARGGGEVTLGEQAPVVNQSTGMKALNENFVSVAKAVTPSVVAITVTSSGKKSDRNTMPRDFFHFFGPDFKTPDSQPEQGSGSGVIITPDGYIVTNNHVVDGADADGIEVTMNDKVRTKAKLIGTDPTTDLAVVKIEGKDFKVAALGNSDHVQVGEWVLAIGNPLGLTSTVTAGIVSAIGRNINIIRDRDNLGIEDFIQTDAAINPGNSGGALVNMSGEVIGINTAIATTNARYQGYGFAVPVNILKTVAADIIKEGRVRRGYIGVQIGPVDQTLASALGMKEPKGVIVQGLVKGGAGEAAGIKEGDVIVSVDGREVNAANELQSYVATHHAGDRVQLKLYREGKTIDITVTLKMRESDKTLVKNEESADEEKEEAAASESPKVITFDKIGMSVRSLTPDEKKDLEVDHGALVTNVKTFGEAFNRFITKNSVITEADRKPVEGASSLKKVIDAHKPGDSVLLRVKTQQGSAFIALQIPKE